jgi:hypothetical protein
VDSRETLGVDQFVCLGHCDSNTEENFTYCVSTLVGLWSLSSCQMLCWLDCEVFLKVSAKWPIQKFTIA